MAWAPAMKVCLPYLTSAHPACFKQEVTKQHARVVILQEHKQAQQNGSRRTRTGLRPAAALIDGGVAEELASATAQPTPAEGDRSTAAVGDVDAARRAEVGAGLRSTTAGERSAIA